MAAKIPKIFYLSNQLLCINIKKRRFIDCGSRLLAQTACHALTDGPRNALRHVIARLRAVRTSTDAQGLCRPCFALCQAPTVTAGEALEVLAWALAGCAARVPLATPTPTSISPDN